MIRIIRNRLAVGNCTGGCVVMAIHIVSISGALNDVICGFMRFVTHAGPERKSNAAVAAQQGFADIRNSCGLRFRFFSVRRVSLFRSLSSPRRQCCMGAHALDSFSGCNMPASAWLPPREAVRDSSEQLCLFVCMLLYMSAVSFYRTCQR